MNPNSLENLNREGFIGDREKVSDSLKEYYKTHVHNRPRLGMGRTKGSFKKGNVAWNKGKKTGQNSELMKNNNPMFRKEVRDKVSDALKCKPQPWNSGEKSHLWKGGITAATQIRFNDSKWREIRKQVYKKDKWTCQDCGTKSKKLNCHHIVPYRINKDNSMDNLITLCTVCHAKRERKINGLG
jgi:5-methylcytosine-specific restriction endonuclease McrA